MSIERATVKLFVVKYIHNKNNKNLEEELYDL